MGAAMSKIEVDTTRLPLLLHELRLPAIARLWPEFAGRSDKEGWPAARLLSALAELEMAERGRRRMARNLADAHLPPGKTMDNFDFSVVPMLSKARVTALAAGDTWLKNATNLLLFGPPESGAWCTPLYVIDEVDFSAAGRLLPDDSWVTVQQQRRQDL
jgi:DNA replication protein DnaC